MPLSAHGGGANAARQQTRGRLVPLTQGLATCKRRRSPHADAPWEVPDAEPRLNADKTGSLAPVPRIPECSQPIRDFSATVHVPPDPARLEHLMANVACRGMAWSLSSGRFLAGLRDIRLPVRGQSLGSCLDRGGEYFRHSALPSSRLPAPPSATLGRWQTSGKQLNSICGIRQAVRALDDANPSAGEGDRSSGLCRRAGIACFL